MDRESILKQLEQSLRFASGDAMSMLNVQLENLEESENYNKFLLKYIEYVTNCIRENKIPVDIDEWKKLIKM